MIIMFIRYGFIVLLSMCTAWTFAAERPQGHEYRETLPQESNNSGIRAQGSEEKVIKKAPPSSAFQDVVQEETGFFNGQFVLETGVTYAHFDRSLINLSGFLALDAIFLGNISVDDLESDVVTFDFAVRYGITDNFQLDLNFPFLYRKSTFRSTGAGGATNALSEQRVSLDPELSDIAFGFTYRILPESLAWPDIVWNVHVKAPTGSDPFGIETRVDPNNSNLVVPERLPSGNGVWSISTGFSFVRSVDPAIVFANLNYFYNLEQSFDDIGSSAGRQPGKVELGNSFQYGVGLAFALNERMSLSLGYSQRFTARTKLEPEGGNATSIIGSDTNIAQQDISLTYAMSPNLTMITKLSAGLTEDAADVTVSVKFPYTF